MDRFWALIEKTRNKDADLHAEHLQLELQKLPAADILEFDLHFATYMAKAHTNDLWGAAYLANGGCSDDCFEYTKRGLIAHGRTVYEAALADPDSLAGLSSLAHLENEPIGYAAMHAYERVSKKKYRFRGVPYPALMSGPSFDDPGYMKQRYPKLYARTRR